MKWNIIDKVGTQVLYAVTGIVLARMLGKVEFGLVGAALVFQAFASLLIDSGFSFALIQKQRPSRLDYSTVLWFNLGIAVFLYIVLFISAPAIAWCFGGDPRLIPISRVMFLGFILNASAIVQTNRLMKRMDVRMVAVSNALGLLAGSIVAILLALRGAGAWAVVWQTLTLNGVKSLVLWLSSGWRPMWRFSMTSLRSFFKVGSAMMASSFLNVLFQNIYSLFIGNRAGLGSLGDYTQADKWSKMGISSLSQVLTSTFLPALSAVQNEPERFRRISAKMNRFTAYLLFPCTCLLGVAATPVFHILFGVKWDTAIPLFQLLLAKGVFTVLTGLYNNYLVALAQTRTIVAMETLRDVSALLFLVITLPWIAMETPEDPVAGIKLLLWGQVAAAAIAWGVMAVRTARILGRPVTRFVGENLPYIGLTLIAATAMWVESLAITDDLALLCVQGITALAIYMGLNSLFNSKIQSEVTGFLFRRKKL